MSAELRGSAYYVGCRACGAYDHHVSAHRIPLSALAMVETRLRQLRDGGAPTEDAEAWLAVLKKLILEATVPGRTR